ncbi:MAG: hypothetical protein ACTFAL_14485 [Candidatus Electronema sp. V4]|uniref:hypothetical protein n=1 Tax=Candidatus Electronema sp. V4 TaxID=3454756 RepID=UPI00405556EE
MKTFLMLCGCLAALTACADSKPDEPAPPPKPIELKYGGTIEEGDLSIQFSSVSSDSRCPTGVQCVWAGNAEIVLELSGDGNHAAALNTNPQFPQSYRTSEHVVTLKELKPYPEAGQTIAVNDYVAVVTVEKK